MTTKQLVTQEMKDSLTAKTVNLTKSAEDHLTYLIEKFGCNSEDEVINILLYYAGTTEFTDKIVADVNKQ